MEQPVNDLGRLVAEAGADGDLVASLGTAAAQHRSTCLGLHAGEKPVGLGAVSAIRLEGALRHLVRLLLNLFCGYSSLSVYPTSTESGNERLAAPR
jgi:hypothetical protein